MKLTIEGHVPSKKNSKQLVMIRGRLVPISSKHYRDWHNDAVKQITGAHKVLDKVERIAITIFAPNKRAFDLTNKVESVMDLLVDCGVIKDDNYNVVPYLELMFGGVDAERPRAEVEILC